jgi:MATE family multidrug resistance protein
MTPHHARPMSGYRQEIPLFLRTALPIIGAQLSFMGMGVVDTIMAGRLGEQPLAAIAVGSNVWSPLFIFFLGLLMAVSPIVAQRTGAGADITETGAVLRRILRLAVAAGAVWMLLLHLGAAPLIGLLGLAPETAQMAVDYVLVETIACIPFCIIFVLRYGAEGSGRTAPVLWVSLAGLGVNALFDWLLMYGHWGFPELGAVGCGWATVIAAFAMLATWGLFYLRGPLARMRLYARGMAPPGIGMEALRLGLPIGCILLAEAGLFSVALLLMAHFGDTAVAAHQVAINFAAVSFMVPLGFGFAATVRVGLAAGARDAAAVRLRGRLGMILGVGFSLFPASIMALRPEWITGLYTRDAEVAALAGHFLIFAAAFQIFDCLQATANGALRGIKDTRMPMLITVSAYWLCGMPVAVLGAFYLGGGMDALWWGLIVGLAVASAGLSLRFLRATRNVEAGS